MFLSAKKRGSKKKLYYFDYKKLTNSFIVRRCIPNFNKTHFMKKLLYSVAIIAAFSLSSCKKAYECTCEQTQKYTYKAIMSQWQDEVDGPNETLPDPSESYTTVVTVDKTTKAQANASCASSEETELTEKRDWNDQDSDSDLNEPAYSVTHVIETECSLEKK
jgi:hypothetical protein